MAPKLTDKDKKRIAQLQTNSPVVKYVRYARENKFNVGDILIEQNSYRSRHSETEWTTKNVSSVASIPKKFVYVYEDDHGVGFIKQIKSNGRGLCDGVICLAETNLDNTRFIVDPEYADHIIIQGDVEGYDPAAAIKEDRAKRLKIYKSNKKLAVKSDTWVDVAIIAAQLKVGDTIWCGYSIYDATDTKYTVEAIKSRPVKGEDTKLGYYSTNDKNDIGENSTGCSTWYDIYCIDKDNNMFIFSTKDMCGIIIFTQQPTPFENALEAK